MNVLLFYPNNMNVGIPPANLAILAAYLKEAGFNVKLFDTTLYRPKSETQDDIRTKLGHVKKTNLDDYLNYRNRENMYSDFMKLIEVFRPGLIGVSLIDANISFSLEFLKLIKDKNIPIVSGGVGTTFLYERILNTGLIDYACIGEGEEALVELAQKIRDKENTAKIKNIYYLNNGVIVKNPLRKLIPINDLLMPDFSIYDDTRFYRPFMGDVVRMTQIDLDRGCPWACTYCAAPSLKKVFNKNKCGPYYRFKSLDKIFNEIKTLVKKYQLEFLWISSETLLAINIDKFRELAKRYKEEVNLPFWCQTRLDTFSDEKTKLLSEMGCKNVSVGLEHGDEGVRNKLLNKKITDEQIIEAAKILKKYKILPTINNMIGLPDETRAEVFSSIKLNKKISNILEGNHNLNIFTFIPFSGTKLRNICLEKGYFKDDGEIPFSFLDDSVLEMPSMSKEEIRGLERTMALYIRLPKSYYHEIKMAENFDEKGNKKFDELIKLMKSEKYKK